jgi:hypothetical protein
MSVGHSVLYPVLFAILCTLGAALLLLLHIGNTQIANTSRRIVVEL